MQQQPIAPRTIMVALVVAIAAFMQMFDSAVISIALPPMAHYFRTTPVVVGFGITIYVLAASIFIPSSAWLADRLGACTLFVGALGAFAIASVLCGLSESLWEFIVARGVQGIAGALMAPVGQLILLRTVERGQLLRVMNLTTAPALVAPVIGPPLGGLLTTWVGWPWIFYINVPACLLAIILALRFLPNLRGERRPFDLTGFTLNGAALAPLLWGLSALGGGRVPALPALAAVFVGLGIGAVALRHARRTAHPLLTLAPLRHLTFRLTSGSGTILMRLPITTLIFVLPIMLQTGFGMTAFLAGMLFLGHSGGDLAMKLFTTRVYRRLGYRTILLVCTIGMSGSIGACAFFTRSTPLAVMAIVLFVGGCFRSFAMTGLMTLAFSEIERSEMPSATTLNQVAMQLATALAVSMSGLVLEMAESLRGGTGGLPTAGDCRMTLAVMAAMALLALPSFLKLPGNAGAVLSGHRQRTDQQLAEAATEA